MDCIPPGPSVHGTPQARILGGLLSPSPGDLPDSGTEPMCLVSPALAGSFFITSTTWEALILAMCCVLFAQLCPTLCSPMDCSLPGSSVLGILQARILEWVAIPFSRGSSQPKNQTWVSYITGRFFTDWATRENISNRVDLKHFTLIRKVLAGEDITYIFYQIKFLKFYKNHMLS